MNISILDLDMYSKRISLFYKSKEKIGSLFGLLLTIIYILASLSLFFVYTLDVIEHKTIRVHDSTIYPREAPSIHLDNNLFYFAFGVEDPTEKTRFIDKTIYYPKVHFFKKIKEVGGNLKIIYEEELKVERCNEMKFGEDYKSLLVSGELNNSYCIQNINLTLTGGLKFDKISYIQIGIYPCVNSTENNNHCKPQEIIDSHLSGSYFSILVKDIGLDPSNYGNPIIHTFQDFYTTIDKSFFRDLILYFGITEIQTDEGLFNEQIDSKRILQFRKESKAFYFKDESSYYNGNTMCDIQIRLGDNIRIQKRSYNKMSTVFATTGGYMQLISTVFTIITLLANKLECEIKLVNSLFNFYPNKRKIIVKREYSKFIIDSLYNNGINKNNLYLNKFNRTEISSKAINLFSNINNISIEKENNYNCKNYNNSKKLILNVNSSPNKIESTIFPFKNTNSPIEKSKNNSLKKRIKTIFEENKNNNNKSKNTLIPCGNDLYSQSISNQLNINKNNSELRHSDYIIDNNIYLSDNYSSKSIKINTCNYYCFSHCRKDKEDIKLFDVGISFYRKKMDIIHLFNIILLIEKFASKNEDNNK